MEARIFKNSCIKGGHDVPNDSFVIQSVDDDDDDDQKDLHDNNPNQA